MRTTVDLDVDVLQVVKDMAREQEQSLGRIISELVRRGLRPAEKVGAASGVIPTLARKPGARPVTAHAVKELLEIEG